MKFFKILISFILCCTVLCGCTKEEIPSYDLYLISPSFYRIYDHYSVNESENAKYIKKSADSYAEYITEETIDYIESVTICDDNLSTEVAQAITDLCKAENIPVFFLMNDVDKAVMDSYDKVYCISADYTYIGEIFAEKINELWQNEIRDKNKDQIFTFSVVKPETLNNIYQKYYDALLRNIELLGIPLQQLEEIFLTKGDVLDYCMTNKAANESFIILESGYMSVFPDFYEPSGEGIEIIGIYFGVENIYEEYPYMKLCFIDYTKYFEARDSIMENIGNKDYPFKNLDYSIIDKNIYIQPVL